MAKQNDSIVKKIIEGVLPLFTDTKPSGGRKLSLGRNMALASAALILYRFGVYGTDPGVGILGFFGTCMVYAGYSKTSSANGNGGEQVTQPSLATPFPSEGQDG